MNSEAASSCPELMAAMQTASFDFVESLAWLCRALRLSASKRMFFGMAANSWDRVSQLRAPHALKSSKVSAKRFSSASFRSRRVGSPASSAARSEARTEMRFSAGATAARLFVVFMG